MGSTVLYVKWLTIKIAGWLFTAVTVVLVFFSWEDIGMTNTCEKISVIFGIPILSLLTAIVTTVLCKKKTNWRRGKASINLQYGDLIKVGFSKKSGRRIIVISVNTHFDTIVSDKLIAESSIHGQWINEFCKNNETQSSLNNRIQVAIKEQKIQPLRENQSKAGNKTAYPRGSIVMLKQGDTLFFLLALSEFDEDQNAQCNREQLLDNIRGLVDFYDKNGQGYPIYIPLLGTELSRVNITEQESLQLLTDMLRLYREKLHGEVNIVVYKKHRSQVPIFN